jgi:rod shape-determining protein MreC
VALSDIPVARRGRLLLPVLVVMHLLVISWQVEDEANVSLLERIVLTVVSPFQRLVTAVIDGTSNVFHSYVDLRGVRDENRDLRERVRSLELALAERQHLAAQAARLREVLELSKLLPYESIVAELVAGEGASFARTVTVNKGSHAGVRLNMPVICPSGVVGRVIAIGPSAAKVQLIVDSRAGVGALIERSRTLGVIEGIGDRDTPAGELPMRFVPAMADVAVGDTVVTSGLDQIYPRGLVVGRVSHVGEASGLVREVFVVPATRFHELENVLLLKVPPSDIETPEVVQ